MHFLALLAHIRLGATFSALPQRDSRIAYEKFLGRGAQWASASGNGKSPGMFFVGVEEGCLVES